MANLVSKDIRDKIADNIRSVILRKLEAIPPAVRAATDLRPIEAASPKGSIKPFQQLLFPEALLRAWEFERTFSTALGLSFELAARTIGQQKFAVSLSGSFVDGPVSPAARSAIDDILRDVKRNGMQASYSSLVEKVVTSYVGTSGNPERIKVDLYLQDKQGNEVFFEMKSPKPNKDQCIGTTEKLLLIHAVRRSGPPRVRTFYAMPFNPYGDDPASYKHSIASNYLDLSEEALIGKEFWDFVGGPGTYEEVLEIYRVVGLEVKPEIEKRFGL